MVQSTWVVLGGMGNTSNVKSKVNQLWKVKGIDILQGTQFSYYAYSHAQKLKCLEPPVF